MSLLLPACIGGSSESPRTTTTTARPSLRVEPIATIDPGRGRVHSVVTWEHYVGWTAGTSGPDEDPNQVFVHDLATKETRVLARTRFRGGTIPRIRASKDSVVYLDMSRIATDADPRTDWHMYEVSVSTGKERRLASSASDADRQDPPLPSVVWPWVAWFQATESDASVQSLDLRNGRHQTLVASTSGEQLSMDDVTATVHYDDDNGAGGRDVFAVPADGSGPPKRITTSGKADFAIARNGGVVWQEPPEADSESLWFKAVDAGQAHRFSTASSDWPDAGSNAFPGRGFVVWLLGPKLLVRDVDARLSAVPLQEKEVSIPARWWVDGVRVAWATLSDVGTAQERSVIHVAAVSVPD